MRRSRTTDVSLGLIAVLINVAIVVAVVIFTGGRSEPPDATQDAISTGTPFPTTPTPTATVTPAPATDISGLVPSSKNLTLAVLGDGTGDEKGEWVTALGELIGATRQVKVRNLDPSDPTRYAAELSYGSTGPKATIWNGSRRGATAEYAAKRLDFLIPATPDAVLLSYGRDNTAANIGPQLSKTLSAIRASWPKAPVAVVLQAQNHDDRIAPVRSAAAAWAKSHRLTTIDVAAALKRSGDPNAYVSVVDPPSVNALGGRLWGATVYRALGGVVAADPAPPADEVSPGGRNDPYTPRAPQPPASTPRPSSTPQPPPSSTPGRPGPTVPLPTGDPEPSQTPTPTETETETEPPTDPVITNPI